jgi:hypothetical protein
MGLGSRSNARTATIGSASPKATVDGAQPHDARVLGNVPRPHAVRVGRVIHDDIERPERRQGAQHRNIVGEEAIPQGRIVRGLVAAGAVDDGAVMKGRTVQGRGVMFRADRQLEDGL